MAEEVLLQGSWGADLGTWSGSGSFSSLSWSHKRERWQPGLGWVSLPTLDTAVEEQPAFNVGRGVEFKGGVNQENVIGTYYEL